MYLSVEFGLKLVRGIDLGDFPSILAQFLRDETGVGRGVHRFWGVPIQKSRSLFGLFFGFYPNFRISGVGVVYSGIFSISPLKKALTRGNIWVGTVIF